MAETQLFSERSDFDYRDLEEGPRRSPASRLRTIFITIGFIVFVLAFLIFMIRGSLPELTPEQIVQMKGYEGQQAPRRIFNLYSLRQYEDANRRENEAAETVATNGSDQTPPITDTLTPSAPENKPDTRAVVQTTVKPARVYEKAALRRQGIIPVIATVNTSAKEVKTPEIEVLPVLGVKGDQARLRSGPSRDSDVLALLNKGDTITVFNTVGKWTHVGINDGSSTTGYIHSSLLGVVERK